MGPPLVRCFSWFAALAATVGMAADLAGLTAPWGFSAIDGARRGPPETGVWSTAWAWALGLVGDALVAWAAIRPTDRRALAVGAVGAALCILPPTLGRADAIEALHLGFGLGLRRSTHLVDVRLPLLLLSLLLGTACWKRARSPTQSTGEATGRFAFACLATVVAVVEVARIAWWTWNAWTESWGVEASVVELSLAATAVGAGLALLVGGLALLVRMDRGRLLLVAGAVGSAVALEQGLRLWQGSAGTPQCVLLLSDLNRAVLVQLAPAAAVTWLALRDCVSRGDHPDGISAVAAARGDAATLLAPLALLVGVTGTIGPLEDAWATLQYPQGDPRGVRLPAMVAAIGGCLSLVAAAVLASRARGASRSRWAGALALAGGGLAAAMLLLASCVAWNTGIEALVEPWLAFQLLPYLIAAAVGGVAWLGWDGARRSGVEPGPVTGASGALDG